MERDELALVTAELFVPDVAAAPRFYTEKLGFGTWRVEQGDARPMFAVVALEGAMLMLADDPYYAGPPLAGCARGLGLDVRIMVADADAQHRRCVEGGVPIVHAIGDRYYGLRDFIVADPDGYRIRFATAL